LTPRVFISIGSNIDRERNIRGALRALNDVYAPLTLSSVYESEALGFEGDNFYNLVAAFNTDEAAGEVRARLTHIEIAHGRLRYGSGWHSRTLDLDLLLYGDHIVHEPGLDIPHVEIDKNAYILRPLAEIAPELRHPESDITYARMWDSFDHKHQKLWKVEFDTGL